MATIIELFRDPHRSTQELLPWYSTGRLDPDDQASVEAHLVGCASCRAELRSERALPVVVAGHPVAADLGWTEMYRNLSDKAEVSRRREPSSSLLRKWLTWPRKFGWLLAGQAAISVLVIAGLMTPAGVVPYRTAVNGAVVDQRAPYHTLGSTPAASVGNAIVIFRPDASEAAIRQTLKDSRARLVDGPTDAGAYVLQIAPTLRDASIATLGRQAVVVLAQPLDPPLIHEVRR